jgi:hypothetical protein
LAIGLRVCDSHPIHADVVVVAELQELYASELGAIAGDDGVWNSKPVDGIGKKRHDLL